MKIIANSVPLSNISTGIGRYIRNLYSAASEVETVHPFFFNGSGLLQSLSDSSHPETLINTLPFLWKLPAPLVFMLRSVRWLYFEQRMRSVCQRQHFDIYHETAFIPAAVGNVPIVNTIHDLSLIHYRETHPKERVLFFNFFFKRRIKHASHVLTVSQFVRSEIIRHLGISPSMVTAVPLAADPVFYPRTREQISRQLDKNGWPHSYILSVGSLEPRKNLHMLVKAIRGARSRLPVLIVGWEGWGDKTWIEMIRQEGLSDRFIFTGYVDDETLACLYSGADVLVYPSIYEGFGLPILEAMACGCPVICSNVSSMPEVAGDAAWLIHPHDSRDIANAIDSVISSAEIRQSLILKGFERSAEFSWRQTALKTIALFDSLMTSRHLALNPSLPVSLPPGESRKGS